MVGAIVTDKQLIMMQLGDAEWYAKKNTDDEKPFFHKRPHKPENEMDRISGLGGIVGRLGVNNVIGTARSLGDYGYNAKKNQDGIKLFVDNTVEVTVMDKSQVSWYLLGCDGAFEGSYKDQDEWESKLAEWDRAMT
eukprot:243905_1